MGRSGVAVGRVGVGGARTSEGCNQRELPLALVTASGPLTLLRRARRETVEAFSSFSSDRLVRDGARLRPAAAAAGLGPLVDPLTLRRRVRRETVEAFFQFLGPVGPGEARPQPERTAAGVVLALTLVRRARRETVEVFATFFEPDVSGGAACTPRRIGRG
jgi:hypothetical protein